MQGTQFSAESPRPLAPNVLAHEQTPMRFSTAVYLLAFCSMRLLGGVLLVDDVNLHLEVVLAWAIVLAAFGRTLISLATLSELCQ